MFIVHHLNNSRSQRVLWLLEELGFEYAIRFYERNKDMTAPAELKLVHPLGKSPVLEDLDAEGGAVTLVETGAICEYLAGKAGGKFGCPIDPREAISYRQFLHYAEGSVMPILFASLVVSKMPLIGRYGAKRLRPMLNVHLDFIENVLAQRTWFAGESLTAADVMMSFPLEAARSRGLVGSDKPATIDWLRRIHARPARQLVVTRELPVLHVHAALVEQGMFNALDNALKASRPDGQVLLQVERNGKEMRMLVCDRGPGLPTSEWERVFNPFYTFSLGDCYDKGTGLGLSICRSIFRVHGGEARIIEPPEHYRHCLCLSLPLPDSTPQTTDHDDDDDDPSHR